ncbi:hypothetical protein R5R35_001556 [Gryllus longicercus]|uniref:Uncharacterized protein n=1 Tax=Gryllus longicercus TaxID=2509291 RepID=A0AAN9ZIB8_9ORTH
MSVKIDDESEFSLFADDQVIKAEDEDDVAYMLRKLEEEYGKWVMEINVQNIENKVVWDMLHDLETSIGLYKRNRSGW